GLRDRRALPGDLGGRALQRRPRVRRDGGGAAGDRGRRGAVAGDAGAPAGDLAAAGGGVPARAEERLGAGARARIALAAPGGESDAWVPLARRSEGLDRPLARGAASRSGEEASGAISLDAAGRCEL